MTDFKTQINYRQQKGVFVSWRVSVNGTLYIKDSTEDINEEPLKRITTDNVILHFRVNGKIFIVRRELQYSSAGGDIFKYFDWINRLVEQRTVVICVLWTNSK